MLGMVIPGLSGSMILLALGNYKLLLIDSVNALYYTIIKIIKGYGLETLDLENDTQLKAAKVVVAFANVEESKDVERVNRTVQRFVNEERVQVEDKEWDEDTGGVSLELKVDFDAIDEIESALNEATSGRVDFKWFD